MSVYRIVGGDVGTRILFTVRAWPVGTPPVPNQLPPVVDMSGATSIKLVIIPPPPVLTQNLPSQEVSASLYTDGKDGVVQYQTVSGDVPALPFNGQPQLWVARAHFTLGSWNGKSEPDTFWVDP